MKFPFFSTLTRYLRLRRSFLWRAILCWVISLVSLNNAELGNYDLRFSLRGSQKADDRIVLILLDDRDFSRIYESRHKYLTGLHEVTELTDSYFWDKEVWTSMLSQLLAQKPQKIGISLYFGENIPAPNLSPKEQEVFLDDRIVWATSVNSLDHLQAPAFANDVQSNLGLNDFRRDDDGIIRRLYPQGGEVFHLAEKLTDTYFPFNQSGLLINYRGDSSTFKTVGLEDVLSGTLPTNFFKDKIVLIGAANAKATQFQTPIGPLSRVEVMAQVVDNLLNQRWIQRFPFWFYAVLLALLSLFAAWIITQYPQSVALIFFFWIATLLASISAWIFDSVYIWIPAFSPSVLLTVTWIIFVGYQASQIERKNFELEQESRTIRELEQLKNNFVSLISHDLKTPIAKIQAIVTRLQTKAEHSELKDDLSNLQVYSEELNRYIQSILKVLRVESRDFKLNREVADLNEVIEEAILTLQPLARNKTIDIHSELEPLFSSEFDVTLIKEVLINLIENAIKYTPNGGWIKVCSEEIDDKILVSVEDSGEGIAPEDLQNVWGKFVRGRDQDLRTKGTGLGLYLVKYFIELHGGQVAMQSQKGKGTKVSFTLPISDDTPEESRSNG